MPVAVAGAEPDQLLALRSPQAEAIADAGGVDRLPDRSRIGVIIGRGGYLTPGQRPPRPAGAHRQPAARPAARARPRHRRRPARRGARPPSDDQLGPAEPGGRRSAWCPNLAASRVANRLDFRGPAYTIDAACASLAPRRRPRRCELLRDGPVRRGAGGRRPPLPRRSPSGASSPSSARSARARRIRPFDRRGRRHSSSARAPGSSSSSAWPTPSATATGSTPSSGASGLASDGRASSLMSPAGRAARCWRCERAWRRRRARPDPGALGLVEAHGTATPAGDEVELETLARVFGPAGDGDRRRSGSGR